MKGMWVNKSIEQWSMTYIHGQIKTLIKETKEVKFILKQMTKKII